MGLRDYLDWHEGYEQPGSALHRRLQVVVRLLRRAMDELPAGPIRVVSLCAGQAADLLGAAEGHPRAGEITGRLVELDPRNVERARDQIAARGLDLAVVEADAGEACAYAGAVPAELVVACGIFGNISLEDIERTVRFLPSLCAPGAAVVWTRHPRDADVLARVQGWLAEAGLEPVEVEVSSEHGYAVGLHRLVGDPPAFDPDQHLFTFIR